MSYPYRCPWRRILLPGALLLLSSVSFAQAGASAAKSGLPSKLQYASPLQAYKAYADQPVESWREANDRVGRIGGWRAYAKEIQTGEPAKDVPQEPAKTPAAPAKAPAAPADPHAGHHGGAKQ
jgi:hypothetical protein